MMPAIKRTTKTASWAWRSSRLKARTLEFTRGSRLRLSKDCRRRLGIGSQHRRAERGCEAAHERRGMRFENLFSRRACSPCPAILGVESLDAAGKPAG